jgi:hypothetical protein
MQFSDAAIKYVAGLVVPDDQRLSHEKLVEQAKQDEKLVKENTPAYVERLRPIVIQLRAYSQENFEIELEKNERPARVVRSKVIRIAYSTLNKDPNVLANIIAHECGHLSLRHLQASNPGADEEYQADYWAGIFLGYFNYDLEKVIKSMLAAPPTDLEHGSPNERALHTTQGYLEGLELQKGILHLSALPGLEMFKTQSEHAPWHRPDVNKLRVEATGSQERSSFNPFK